jgi:hypothetical protein
LEVKIQGCLWIGLGFQYRRLEELSGVTRKINNGCCWGKWEAQQLEGGIVNKNQESGWIN